MYAHYLLSLRQTDRPTMHITQDNFTKTVFGFPPKFKNHVILELHSDINIS